MSRKEKQQDDLRGVIAITSRNTGYVTVEEYTDDIEIPYNLLNTALNGDIVRIALHPQQKGRRIRGEITEIIKRAKTRFVGVIEKRRGLCYLISDDRKMYVDIELSSEEAKNIKSGIKVLVEISVWNDPKKSPEGKVIRVLGRAGEHEVEMQAVVLAQGFDTRFPEDVEKEAAEIGKNKERSIKEGMKGRRDLRGTSTFTIDPIDAKDFDDALSFKKLENDEYEIGIHIADVTHYVRPGSVIDEEAQFRGTSIYLVDRTIPMLPEVLSNDVCSLKQNEDRLTFSAIFVLDKDAKIKDRWFGRTVIHSNKRFHYKEAQEVLEKGRGLFADELKTLNLLAKKLRERRMREGSIDFEQDEVKFEIDEKGKLVDVYLKPRLESNMLIEDFMLLANREVAEYVYKLCKNVPARNQLFVYRIHDIPDPEKIEQLGVFVRAVGYHFDAKRGDVSAKEINRLFKEIEGKPEEELIKVATIRSMAKAVYATKNIGHFGLSFRYYTHFTSPIRRYPDMMVHRILWGHLDGSLISPNELRQYRALAIQSSEREASAVIAERESVKYKQVEYMKERIGKVFEATISGVTDFGIFVQEKKTHAEGLIKISAIGDDYYEFDKEHYQIIGKKTKKRYRLGDTVKVKLVGADTKRKELDFVFVQE